VRVLSKLSVDANNVINKMHVFSVAVLLSASTEAVGLSHEGTMSIEA